MIRALAGGGGSQSVASAAGEILGQGLETLPPEELFALLAATLGPNLAPGLAPLQGAWANAGHVAIARLAARPAAPVVMTLAVDAALEWALTAAGINYGIRRTDEEFEHYLHEEPPPGAMVFQLHGALNAPQALTAALVRNGLSRPQRRLLRQVAGERELLVAGVAGGDLNLASVLEALAELGARARGVTWLIDPTRQDYGALHAQVGRIPSIERLAQPPLAFLVQLAEIAAPPDLDSELARWVAAPQTDPLPALAAVLEAAEHADLAEACYREHLRAAELAEAWPSAVADWLAIAGLASRRDRPQAALDALEAALPLAQRLGDVEVLRDVQLAAGDAELARGKFERAVRRYEAARCLGSEADDAVTQALALTRLGDAHAKRQDPEQAIECLKLARDAYERAERREETAEVLLRLGLLFQQSEQFDEALAHLEWGLAVSEEFGRRADAARAERLIGELYVEEEQYAQAEACFKRALAVFEVLGDKVGAGYAAGQLGRLHKLLSRTTEALQAFQSALASFEAAGDRAGVGNMRSEIGLLYHTTGALPEAQASLEQALTIARELGDAVAERGMLNNLGLVRLGLGADQDAATYFQQALALAAAAGDQAGMAASQQNLGVIAYRAGDYQTGRDRLERAISLHAAVSDDLEVAGALDWLGDVYSAMGQRSKAWHAFARGATIYRALSMPEEETGMREQAEALGPPSESALTPTMRDQVAPDYLTDAASAPPAVREGSNRRRRISDPSAVVFRDSDPAIAPMRESSTAQKPSSQRLRATAARAQPGSDPALAVGASDSDVSAPYRPGPSGAELLSTGGADAEDLDG